MLNIDFPTHCEYCNSELVWDSVNLVCPNDNCLQKEKENFKAWCLNLCPVEGLKWTTIDKIIQKYYNSNYDILNYLSFESFKYVEYLPVLEKNSTFSENTLFNKMLFSMKYDKIPISNFLLALNIQGLGKITAKKWYDYGLKGLQLLYKIFCGNLVFSEIDEIQNITQDSNLTDYLIKQGTKYKDLFYLVKDRLVYYIENEIKKEKGKVCITGTLSMKRNDFIEILENQGWQFTNNITKDIKYLITNTPETNTSKNKKADELGIIKITEKDFINNVLKGEKTYE